MTNAELAVLGLVVEKPRHGYEIEQVIEERGMRNWTEIGFSSIYYVLKKLGSQGLLSATTDEDRAKGPARKVFKATRKGRAAWRKETREALASPRRQYPDIYLGMAGMPGLTDEEVARALEEHDRVLQDRLEEISRARERSGPDLPMHVEAMFSYGESTIAAERDWVRRFVADLKILKEQK